MNVCNNPDVLRVIYFILLIIDVVKIVIPIALIIYGLIDFSKAVINSDEKVQKKSWQLFFKRILYAILVFAVPWIIEVLMVTLGNVIGEPNTTNFTDCIENATSTKIKELETGKKAQCWECNSPSFRTWDVSEPKTSNCGSGWHIRNDLNENNCK